MEGTSNGISPDIENGQLEIRQEVERPLNETERKAFNVYESYFGPNWQKELRETLFIDVRSATNEDRAREGPNVGWVSTTAEATVPENHVIKNHVIIFNEAGTSDWPLRTEVGESLWNLLENAAVTRSLPSNENGVARGFGNLVHGNVTTEAVVDFSAEILDRWNQAYTQKPTRYAGMNPDSPREYHGIPEWKSEGFADAIAIEIRRRSGNSLDPHEQAVWSFLNHHAQGIITISVDAFLPPVVKINPGAKP